MTGDSPNDRLEKSTAAPPPGLRLIAVGLGFLSLAGQCLLLREFFVALYGSDMAWAFTLAAWTALGGAGALFIGPRLARQRRLSPGAGLVLYVLLVGATLLGVRRWAAGELF